MTLAVQFKDGAVVFEEEMVAFGCVVLPCDNCSGTVPLQLQVDVEGYGTVLQVCNAGECSAYNGTRIVTSSSACTWHVEVGPMNCAAVQIGRYVNVQVVKGGAGGKQYRVEIKVGSMMGFVPWNIWDRYASAWSNTKPDCTAWNNEEVSYLDSSMTFPPFINTYCEAQPHVHLTSLP